MNRPLDRMRAEAAAAPDLTDNEMRALAYFAVGVSSEGSVGGRDVSNRLSFAGTVANGIMNPAGNSGYSIGTLQIDLGQRPQTGHQLVAAYQSWADVNQPDWRLTEAQRAQTVHDLTRNGRTIRAENGRSMDAVTKQRLDQFLQSDDGIRFVHDRDSEQVEELMTGVVQGLRGTRLYRESTVDDRVTLAAMMIKLENQSGAAWVPRFLERMDNGTYAEVDDVNQAISGLLPGLQGGNDYLESGRDNALRGAHVFSSLREMGEDNPLRQSWQSTVENPLVDPTRLGNDPDRRDLHAEYSTVKTLFMQYQQAPELISALERGTGYAYGRPRQEGGNAPTAGLYASGDDLVVWNRSGHGHARIGGAWSEIEISELTRARNPDGSVDLSITRDGDTSRLLRADPNADPLRLPQVERRASADREESATEHPILLQARAEVHRLDALLGRAPDEASERMSASLACLARQNGLSRIDHVVMSAGNAQTPPGQNVFVVQGRLDDPAHLRAHMSTDVAVQTPVSESLQQLQKVDQQLAENRLQQEPAQVQQESHRRMIV